MPANLEISAVATGLEKLSFHSNPKERESQRCSNYCTIACISHASKVRLKFLQTRLQQYVSCELPDVQAVLFKCRGSRDQIANILWIIEKAREFRKTSISALLTVPKPLTVWIRTFCGKFFKRWEYQTTYLPPRNLYPGQEATELDMEQQTGQIGNGVHQGCILSPCLFNLYEENIMWNARLDEVQAEIKIAGRNINNFRYADDTTLMAESEELNSLLIKVKE